MKYLIVYCIFISDGGSTQSSQRKKIVWKETDTPVAEETPESASTSAAPVTLTTVRGGRAPRARRARYATAAAYSTRGRGDTTWVARGRGRATRRRTMY